MSVKVYSCLMVGLEGKLVEVEADILQGLSAFTIVGLGDTSVQESKERIRSAIKNTNAQYPQQKKIINLAPAWIKKHGPVFDLPIALSLLAASGQLDFLKFNKALFIGELALDGTLRPIQNALSIAGFAKENGWTALFLPQANAKEASFIKDLNIYPISDLQQLIAYLKGEISMKPWKETFQHRTLCKQSEKYITEDVDLSLIQGQEHAKRALQIAAAGSHHLLLHGVPGVGKTLLAKALISLLPDLSEEEMLETMKIYSSAGLINHQAPFMEKRPFRQIHHSATLISMIGGGNIIRPGEISLAHNGVLFLDEIAEFPRSHLESLRQPLEAKEIHIARHNGTIAFPANFTLVAAMNPCPCGYYKDQVTMCICPNNAIINYRKKLSGPLLDRLDLTVSLSRQKIDVFSQSVKSDHRINTERDSKVNAEKNSQTNPTFKISTEKLTIKNQNTCLKALKEQIHSARSIQMNRFKNSHVRTNSQLTSQNIGKFIKMETEAEEYFKDITEKVDLSARAYLHLIKVSQTIADLNEHNKIMKQDVAEAFQYRQIPWK